MASTPEGTVKDSIKRVLDGRGPSNTLWYYMPMMGTYGANGIGDFVCCVNKYFLMIEAKAKAPQQENQKIIEVCVNRANGLYLLVGPKHISVEDLNTIIVCLQNDQLDDVHAILSLYKMKNQTKEKSNVKQRKVRSC
jgi:hypothetical protein